MPPNRFESEVGNFLEGSHGDRTHIKRAGHHTVTPLCGTLLTLRGIACEIAEIQSGLSTMPQARPTGMENAGGQGRSAGGRWRGPAAAPVDNGAWPQYPQTTATPRPDKFRMQFPHDTDPCTLKNRRISTIRLQHLKYTQGNCMRNCRNPVRTQHHATSAPHRYGERRRAGPQCRWSVAGPGRGASG